MTVHSLFSGIGLCVLPLCGIFFLTAAAPQTDIQPFTNATEVQSPIDPPDDPPDYCPDPGDYPDPNEWNLMQGKVERFISDSSWASAREDIGANHLTLDQLHPLLDATDAETCRQIQNKINFPIGVDAEGQDRVLHAYFQAGDFFFAVTMSVPLNPEETFLGIVLHIYDENLNFITGYL